MAKKKKAKLKAKSPVRRKKIKARKKTPRPVEPIAEQPEAIFDAEQEAGRAAVAEAEDREKHPT